MILQGEEGCKTRLDLECAAAYRQVLRDVHREWSLFYDPLRDVYNVDISLGELVKEFRSTFNQDEQDRIYSPLVNMDYVRQMSILSAQMYTKSKVDSESPFLIMFQPCPNAQ